MLAGWRHVVSVAATEGVHVAAKAAETVTEAVTMMKSTFRRKKI